MQPSGISNADKIIAILSYLTLGFVGIIWLIINHIFIKKTHKQVFNV